MANDRSQVGRTAKPNSFMGWLVRLLRKAVVRSVVQMLALRFMERDFVSDQSFGGIQAVKEDATERSFAASYSRPWRCEKKIQAQPQLMPS